MTNAERINAHNAELREAIGIAEALPDAAVIEPLSVTKNGTYTAPSGGYSPVTVNVPIPEGYIVPSGTKNITENGTHDVTEYASVEVNVASSGGGEDTMVGTWIFNEVLDLPEFDYYFNFVLTNVADSPQFYNLYSDASWLYYWDVDDYDYSPYYNGAWQDPDWRTITITEEPTDAECIAWLKANARKATYEDGFAEGEKAILSTYVDWAVSAVSASCIVDFASDCNYYAKIWVQIAENMSGEEHMEEFVLAPYDSYSISTEEMGWVVRESQWSVNVSIMGFSKDGEF